MDVATQRCLRRAKPIVSDMMRYIIRKERDAHALEGEALLEDLHQSVVETINQREFLIKQASFVN